ncbi:sugar transferase [uncultured Dysosmobacter sp.]|uniref:sugar transferase n=1 Tax=uncultured Dysosmobacter sp. TaxID=2591384 RepID=UPI00262828D8|nr:sugar transferase [uncultured Dysosmobacter sp.]
MNEPVSQLAELPLETTQASEKDVWQPFEVKRKTIYELFKRCADIVLALLGSIVLLIPIAVIAVLIVCKDPGNPFYVHTRIGKGHKPIRVMKLRTMCRGADRLEEMLTPEQLVEYRREYKIHDDPRLIGWKKPGDGNRCFGARLRQTSLDEIMQIPYNILLKGNMSFVGPRPIMEDELKKNYTPEQQKLLLSVKPGLTGYWQAYARNNAVYEDGKRQRMELYYIQNRSLGFDIKIFFKTVGAVLSKAGAR